MEGSYDHPTMHTQPAYLAAGGGAASLEVGEAQAAAAASAGGGEHTPPHLLVVEVQKGARPVREEEVEALQMREVDLPELLNLLLTEVRKEQAQEVREEKLLEGGAAAVLLEVGLEEYILLLLLLLLLHLVLCTFPRKVSSTLIVHGKFDF